MTVKQVTVDGRLIYMVWNYALSYYTFALINNHTGVPHIIVSDMKLRHKFEDDEYDLYFDLLNKAMMEQKNIGDVDLPVILDLDNQLISNRLNKITGIARSYLIKHLFVEELKILERLSFYAPFEYLGFNLIK